MHAKNGKHSKSKDIEWALLSKSKSITTTQLTLLCTLRVSTKKNASLYTKLPATYIVLLVSNLLKDIE